jgi:hypothetical protein
VNSHKSSPFSEFLITGEAIGLYYRDRNFLKDQEKNDKTLQKMGN